MYALRSDDGARCAFPPHRPRNEHLDDVTLAICRLHMLDAGHTPASCQVFKLVTVAPGQQTFHTSSEPILPRYFC